ncbi:MAG: hypothetical protein ACE5G8_17695, partial [Anaerolineae bacterium]
MKNLPLATWMEHCADYVAPLKDSLGTAVFEGVLHAVTTGQAGMLASILEGAARNAVATGRGLDGALA